MANIIHTFHMEFHVDFSRIEDVTGCGPNVLSCEYKAGGGMTLSIDKNSRIVKSHGLWL
jgi:hypothetical protein